MSPLFVVGQFLMLLTASKACCNPLYMDFHDVEQGSDPYLILSIGEPLVILQSVHSCVYGQIAFHDCSDFIERLVIV